MPDWTLVLPNNTTLGLTESNDLAVVGITGAGMPPIKNVYTPYGLSDGALWQRASVQPRLVTVLIDAVGTSWVGLHNLRAKLVEAVNPHGATPITIQYSAGGSKPDLHLDCYYDSGLEGGITEGFAEKGMALRLLATDPYWQQGTSTTADLAHIQTVTDVSGVVWRAPNGTLSNMDTGVRHTSNLEVRGIARANNAIEVFGAIDSAGDPPTAVDLAAEWDGTEWRNLAPPFGTIPDYVSSGNIYWVAQGPTALWIAGRYEGPDYALLGVVWGYVAATDTWTYILCGDHVPMAIAVSPSGLVYINSHSGSEGNLIEYYDGTTWQIVAVCQTYSFYPSLAFAPDGTLYVGGSFTKIDGVSATNVAKYTPSTDTWAAMGNGLDDQVLDLLVGPDGRVYAGGHFHNSGSAARAHVAAWNGVAWEALGNGLNGVVSTLAWTDQGLLAGGVFDATGTRALPSRAAWWRDNQWLDAGTGYASADMGIYVFSEMNNDMVLGGRFYGTWTASGRTVVTNSGTARAYPIITLAGPGALYYIINWTTNQWLYFDLTLLDGETLTLDLRPGIKTITSSFRGNCLPFLVSGNLIDWHLDPGANDIGVWIDNASATASISFTARYWSADGAST